ncbi:MAG: DUF58 domain-containing protein [Lentisphaeria bacterium]|nr:DUF58 domain-containing protein [Lentisphaeria bacterium]MDP7743299.1 DUF58 domain-containing protein [Lentisphaeria bacterium]
MATSSTYNYLDAEALGRLKNLSIAARHVVEGFFAGMHKSPHKGFSVEFSEHRLYTPGTDPRHIDWRVFGRRDKLYVKQYEEETSMRCYLLLDKSASMGYKSDGPLTKLEYGSFLAATLAYLMAHQHDAAGLITFDDEIRQSVPVRQGASGLRTLMDALENTEPGNETKLSEIFHQLAETIKRRSLVIIISDLFDDPAAVVGALNHFRHKKHDVIVLHTLDPAELTFPFDDVSRIEDMETGREITSDPRAFRTGYLEALATFLETVRGGCLSSQIDYAVAETNMKFDAFLGTYLARRQRLNS